MAGEHGYFVTYEKARSRAKHVFCGAPKVSGAECPNCRKPLLQFLALDTTDPRVGLAGWRCPVVPLLFCWTCNVAQAPFSYRVAPGKVVIVKYKRGGVRHDFPYEDYPCAFPAALADLVPVSKAEAAVAARLNRDGIDYESPDWRELDKLDRLRHQVGGEPRLIQGNPPWPFNCPRCRRNMQLFATIADDCLDPRGFTGNCGVQVLFYRCDRCQVIGVRQECD